jgi:hypothetical protein
MTFPQLAILVLLSGLLAVFATDRFRIELVALSGLAAGVLLGLVSFTEVFGGFANPAVITVAEILMLTGVIARSSLMDILTRRLARFARSDLSVLPLVCSLGALTSAFMNNIGALALWIPVTLSLCRSTGVAPGKVLMPLSFATLLGGTCSLIGTPANLVVSSLHGGDWAAVWLFRSRLGRRPGHACRSPLVGCRCAAAPSGERLAGTALGLLCQGSVWEITAVVRQADVAATTVAFWRTAAERRLSAHRGPIEHLSPRGEPSDKIQRCNQRIRRGNSHARHRIVAARSTDIRHYTALPVQRALTFGRSEGIVPLDTCNSGWGGFNVDDQP